jgi:deoxyribodipyrimidine photo-lyase
MECDFFSFKDQVVFSGGEVLKKDGTPYRVFTPYKNAWLGQITPDDLKNYKPDLKKIKKLEFSNEVKGLKDLGFKETDRLIYGGELEALKVMRSFLPRMKSYHLERDFIARDTNSQLSPYIRFGCISIRELVRRCYFEENKGAATWLSELIWREFYQMILFNFPKVIKNSFIEKYNNINWKGSASSFKKWKEGKTGYPLIDAAMIHFSKTGQMHNRLRMIVASFLVKDLLIDWRKGEKYFADKLLDFDLASNNGGWQWCASTGCDAQPYFRIFNPITQSRKFDPDGDFIRKHLPVLKNFNNKDIHFPSLAKESAYKEAKCYIGVDYPNPIVDHSTQRHLALEMFKEAN